MRDWLLSQLIHDVSAKDFHVLSCEISRQGSELQHWQEIANADVLAVVVDLLADSVGASNEDRTLRHEIVQCLSSPRDVTLDFTDVF